MAQRWRKDYVSREEIVIIECMEASSFRFVSFISCLLANSPIGSSSRPEQKIPQTERDFASITLKFANGHSSRMGRNVYILVKANTCVLYLLNAITHCLRDRGTDGWMDRWG